MSELINTLIVALNLIILGLNLKLYTEYFKDRSQVSRQQQNIETGKTSHNSQSKQCPHCGITVPVYPAEYRCGKCEKWFQ